MTELPGYNIIAFGNDMTLRWPCRRGDFILSFGFPGILSTPEAIRIKDVWEMQDGYHVTVTNRLEDLPIWFRLHPTEVCDSFAYQMMPKVEKGDYPAEPMEGPNLWRIKSGERMAWVGRDRPERHSRNGVLAVLDFVACALVVGEGHHDDLNEFAGFGRLTKAKMNAGDIARCQFGVEVVRRLGLPDTWSPEWLLG
jgi:hypothetical protein